MTSEGEEKNNSTDKTDPPEENLAPNKDPWSKYKKVRKIGRIEKRPPTFPTLIRNDQILTITNTPSEDQWSNQNGVNCLARVTSDSDICSSDVSVETTSTMPCKDNTLNNYVSSVSNDSTVASNDYNLISNNSTVASNLCDEGTREKKNSITISIHEEIRKSFSRTRSLSVSMIKNIFKNSKTFHNSSDTLISTRRSNTADAIIPNFIFKYHTEDVDDPLPQSATVGWFRQCCTAFSMGMNTLVCGILLGLMSSNDSIRMTLQFCSIVSQQDMLLIWIKYAFVLGFFISCFFWWEMINYFGRRVTNLFSSFMLLLSFIIFIISNNVVYFVLGFALGGISSSSCFINNSYLPECVEEKMFIPTSVIFTSMMFIGIYLTNLVLMWFSFDYLVYISIGLLILSFIFVFSLPESPAYYFKKNEVENARKAITWFKDRENELLVSYEMTIVLSKFTEKNKSLSWSCFACKANLNALYLSLIFMFATALNTCVFFKLYPPIANLFNGNLKPFVVDCIIFILPISILFAFIKVLFNSKRKKLLVTSYSLLATSLVLLSICWNFVSFRRPGEDVEQMFIDWLILLSFVMFTVSFLLSSFIVPHVLYFEIFSHETMSCCLSCLYGFGAFVTLIFVSISNYVDFIGFGACLFLMSLLSILLIKVIIIYLPETKDEVFQKIRKKFRRIKKLKRNKKVSIFTIGDCEIDV